MKLSVCCISYNHGKFIAEALDGFLNQKTNFDVEIIVSDDCSTDSTAAILQGYAEKYPGKLTLLLHEKNIGMMPNLAVALSTCTGLYVALCEGDDYWTDPLKLQKQVDFLEANPDYAICFHKVNVLRNGVFVEDDMTKQVPETTTIYDLAQGNYMHTCSVVYRNNLFTGFPAYFKKSPIGDYFLHMLNARYGHIKYMDEIIGVYRLHETSGWSSKSQNERYKIWVKFLKNIQPNFNSEVQAVLQNQIARFSTKNKRNIFFRLIRKLKSKLSS